MTKEEMEDFYNKFQNLLDIQKALQMEFIDTRFSRKECIQLRNLFGALIQLESEDQGK
ncbi:MAG: hypothetical protein KBT03_01240 [Bacteroidales bacterium]|nr:hypothetical protein [Candidatus Scybalousia scybalohippi]